MKLSEIWGASDYLLTLLQMKQVSPSLLDTVKEPLLTLGACAARVTVVSLSVCVSICLSVTVLTATYLICKAKVRYHRVLYGVLQICNVWTLLKKLRSKVMALFAYHCCLPHSLKRSRWTEETAVSCFQDEECAR